MKDKIAKFQAIAAKWEATASKLRAEIARREASGRGETKALKAARARLAKAEQRRGEAGQRMEAIARRQRASEAARAHGAAIAASFAHLDELSPAAMRQWERERKDEPKRIAKRKKALERRTRKDQGADSTRIHFGTYRRRQAAAPMPAEAETFPTGPIIPYAPPTSATIPDRPGLLPEDFRLIVGRDDFDVYRTPKDWTPEHVGRRMVEAFAVLRRLPMVTRPKSFGSAMPEYINEGVELAYQAGAGTLKRTRAVRGISADEAARADQALGWPLAHLKECGYAAAALNTWANAEAASNGDGSSIDGVALEAAALIATALNRGKVKVM